MENYSWNLKRVCFRLVHGDLFSVGSKAIVNSEQTDFQLAYNENTISGQIRSKEGLAVQAALDRQTDKRIQPKGTVLSTEGGHISDVIYHLGFRDPREWPDDPEEETEFINIIRNGIGSILRQVDKDKNSSIAFPLIGCGIFGLNPELLAYEFVSELLHFVSRRKSETHLEISLVVSESDDLRPIIQAAVQAAIDSSSSQDASHYCLETGVDYLDKFAGEKLNSSHSEWCGWMLARYFELLVRFMFAHMANAVNPKVLPARIIDPNYPLTFAIIRVQTEKLSEMIPAGMGWASYFSDLIGEDLRRPRRILESINRDKNDIAHGKATRSADEIFEDIRTFIDIESWHQKASELKAPPMSELTPWIFENTAIGEVGVLHSWSESNYSYVGTVNGETFHIKRSVREAKET